MRVIIIIAYTKECGFSLDKPFSEFLPVKFRKPTTFQYPGTLATMKLKETSAYDRQNANLRTKCPIWSFRLCSSKSTVLAVLWLSGTYFPHWSPTTFFSSSSCRFRAQEDSISPSTRNRSMAKSSNSSIVTSPKGGFS